QVEQVNHPSHGHVGADLVRVLPPAIAAGVELDPLQLDHDGRPQRALTHETPNLDVCRVVAEVEPDTQLHACASAGLHHRLGLDAADRHRLLHEHVLARV